MKVLAGMAALLVFVCPAAWVQAQHGHAEPEHAWRTASAEELADVLPARAPVVQERIETEASTNSGITDAHGHVIAATVLITAGYAAHGKYSQYLVVGAPVQFGASLALRPAAYLIGWTRDDAGLRVTFYEAANGAPVGTVEALPSNPPLRVVPVRIWPPAQHSLLQIGRFVIPYELR
jgi:hypothetical protein